MDSSTLTTWIAYLSCGCCVQVLCRRTKQQHLHVRCPHQLSDYTVKWRIEIVSLIVHAMQEAAEMVLNRCTKHTCQGRKEILTLVFYYIKLLSPVLLFPHSYYYMSFVFLILLLLLFAHVMQGAAEMVLDRCTRYIETDGSTVELSDEKKKELGDMISSMADKGLRTLCLSYRDYRTDSGDEPPEESPDEDLTACCVVGIKVCVVFVHSPLLLEKNNPEQTAQVCHVSTHVM